MKFNEENMKRTLLRRIYTLCAALGLLVVLLGVRMYLPHSTAVGGGWYTGFIVGWQTGVLIGLTLFVVFYLVKYLAALHDPDRARTVLIAERDERTLFIEQKVGKSSYKYVIAGLLLAAVIAGYFSAAAFAALLGAVVLEAAVRIVLRAYYIRKI